VFVLLLLLAVFGSRVPVGSASVAVFEIEPVAEPAMVPLMVMVTEPLAGRVAIVPETKLPVIPTELGHIAPFRAFEQLADKPLIAVLTVSEKLVPPAALGPALLITKV
jgi:hypothetical protein